MKQIYLTLFSGLCNRLIVLACAMRIQKKFRHQIAVFWCERTGRFGVPYQGPVTSEFSDFYQPVDGIQFISIRESIKFQAPVSLDWESILPENLKRYQVDGHFALPDSIVQFINDPKVVDPNQDLIIIQKMTMPFGIPGDPMQKYVGYPDRLGIWKKDNYLAELSEQLQSLRPTDRVSKAVADVQAKMRQFSAVCGIHLRVTDLQRIHNQDHLKIVNRMISQAETDVGFFIATDDPNLIPQDVLQRDNVITYPEPLKTENSTRGVQHGMVDLYSLASCQQLYGTAGSSFSLTAWLLSSLETYEILW